MQTPWWMTETYATKAPIAQGLFDQAGPQGVATVRLWPNGKTDSGWSESKFMGNYTKGAFLWRPIVAGFVDRKWNFAIVMRSVRAVCIDIDGKNGGLQGALALGMLPPTLAETSKSGNGFHLFYSVLEDEWDDELGYAMFADRIGIRDGVDIRATGCVYRHPQQAWNARPMVELPDHMKQMLHEKQQMQAAQITQITRVLNVGDEEEVLMLQHSLEKDLAKPIPAGRRNTTLFAIGQQMQAAGVPDWDDKVFKRAIDVGLDQMEASKIVANVIKYGSQP